MPGICKDCNAKFINKKAKCIQEGHTFVMTRDLLDDGGHCNHRFKVELGNPRELGTITEVHKATLDDGSTVTRVHKRPMFTWTRSQCVWCRETLDDCVQWARDDDGSIRAIEVAFESLPRPPRVTAAAEAPTARPAPRPTPSLATPPSGTRIVFDSDE